MNSNRFTEIATALSDPDLGAPLGVQVTEVALSGDTAVLELTVGFPIGGYEATLTERLAKALAAGGFTGTLKAHWRADIRAQAVQASLKPLPAIRNILAIASGKGGVGKSTTAANLAIAFARQGARVGLLDADIYGPSQPLMMGLAGQRPMSTDGKRMRPLTAHGVEVMSIGFLIDPAQPMVWRGPMVTQALVQLLSETEWGDLDYLIVDMPPGTGDTQLTLAQRVPVSGALIVTTPQDIALLDARKGLEMFRKVSVPVLGVIENMAMHICSQCGHAESIFGVGGGERMAAEYQIPLLGSLPLDIQIREHADRGVPTVALDPTGRVAASYLQIARRAAARLACGVARGAFPTLAVSDD